MRFSNLSLYEKDKIMEDIVKYLQNIQDNLIGIILPVLITAVISIITLFCNAITQIVLQNSKNNNEQYKLMQAFYPKMKLLLLELKFTMQDIESNPIFDNWEKVIGKYISYKESATNYRKSHESEIQDIDNFILLMEKHKDKVIAINKHLLEFTIPRTPVMHPFLKDKVNQMLGVLYYYSSLWKQYQDKSISLKTFQYEITNFKNNWKTEIVSGKIEDYLLLLNKWFLKY